MGLFSKNKVYDNSGKEYDKHEHIVPQVKRLKDQDSFDSNIISATNDEGLQASLDSKNAGNVFRSVVIWIGDFIGIKSTVGKKVVVKDQGKKQRALFLAFVITAGVSALKYWRADSWDFGEALMVSFLAAMLSYVGLIWVLRFDITRRSLCCVLTQAAIFVFSSMLFLILFFFGQFERIYESFVFIAFLLGFVFLLTLVFLTANILNVSIMKKIPLFRVGQTASYAITLFSVFFLTISFISSDLDIFVLIPILLLLYILSIGVHLSHFAVKQDYILWYALGVSWAAIVLLMAFLFWPISGLLVSFIPVVVVYSGLGIIMYHIDRLPIQQLLWEFLLLAILSLGIIVFQAQWGIGGAFWM